MLTFTTFAQKGKFVDTSEITTKLYKKPIKCITIKCDEDKYGKAENAIKAALEKGQPYPTGYYEEYGFDFFKRATVIKSKDSLEYVINFNLEKGFAIYINIDTLVLPEGTEIKLFDPDGKVIKDYGSKLDSVNFPDKGKIYKIEFRTKNSKFNFIVSIKIPAKTTVKYKCNILGFYFDVDKSFGKLDKAPNITNLMSIPLLGENTSSTCNYNIQCFADRNKWINEINSVVRIFISYVTSYPTYINNYGTATLVLNSYQTGDRFSHPYVLTAGHLFYESRTDHPFTDISALITKISVDFKCENALCNDPLTGGCNNSEEGLALVTKGLMTSSDDHIFDYALLQFNSLTLSDLATDYHITYAGYTSKYFSQGELNSLAPYYCFHHGGANQKQYMIDEYAFVDNGSYYNFYSSDIYGTPQGYSEKGSSGAPVFNKEFQMVGIMVTGQNSCNNPHEQQNVTVELSQVFTLDPIVRSRLSPEFNTFDPEYLSSPDHCRNCELDSDKGEIFVDCGGKCNPCSDLLATDIVYNNNLQSNIVSTSKSIVIDGNSSSLLLPEGSSFSAQQTIELKGNVDMPANVSLTTGSIPFIDTRKCTTLVCPPQISQYFTPDNDGIDDAITCLAPYTKKYEVSVFTSNNDKIYSGSGNVTSNKRFPIYKGENRENYFTLFYILYLYDCYNKKTEKHGFFVVIE